MRHLALVWWVLTLTGCGSLAAVGVAQENAADFRKAEASVRHQSFCNMSVAAAFERFTSKVKRDAVMELCDDASAR